MRLSWCDQTDSRGGMDSPRSSRFKVVVKRRSSSLSYVQVLGMASGFEGSPTMNSVMGPDDGDGSEYIPR
jgi:hypothetical protein